MPSRIPFVRPMYDDSASSARISDLIRMRGNQQADAIARAGAISGQMWQNVGQSIAGAVEGYTRAKADDQERRRIETARAEEQSIKDAIRLTPRDEKTGRLDSERIADEVARIDPVKALDWWKRADDQTRAELASDRERSETVAKAAGSLLVDLEQTPPPMRQPKWEAARSQALEQGLLTSPDEMPEQVDMGWLRSTFNQARSLSDIAREVQAIGEKDEETFTLSAGQVRYGRDPETGETVEVARGPDKTAEPARAGTFEALVDAMATEKGRPLSTQEVLTARRSWMDAGRRPNEAPNPPQISQAQRAAAERWKQNELRGAEKVFREATKDLDRAAFPEDESAYQEALAELNDTKGRIQLSYLEQIGSTETTLPVDRPGEPKNADASATPPAPGRPAASPFGASTAEAAPAGPKVGDVVTVKGQKVRVTRILPNGKAEVVPVP